MSVSEDVVGAKQQLLLRALGEGHRRHNSDDGVVLWRESLHDHVMRLRIDVAGIFESASRDHNSSPNDAASELTSIMRLVQADVVHRIQLLIDNLPRTIYQETIQHAMSSEYHSQQAELQRQLQHIQQQQHQLYNAKRLHQSHTATDAVIPTGGSFAGPSGLSPTRMTAQNSTTPRRLRPASASAASLTESFPEAHLRQLYTQLHECRSQMQSDRNRIEALKAFCIRKDAAMDYVRETLLQEVVVLKEQLRRQDHDPNFISDFVTLFDCWKVLEGDDPDGGNSGSSTAVQQAKKELLADAARAQMQAQMVIRKKDDEIAELQKQLTAAQSVATQVDKKKIAGKGKKGGDDFHEQFLQLTADLAKKDVCIADMAEELKHLQTEVAIAQQLAKSTRDQLNRSNIDVENAVAIRDGEIAAKTELIGELENEIRDLRSASNCEEMRQRQEAFVAATATISNLEQNMRDYHTVEVDLRSEIAHLRSLVETRDADILRLTEAASMTTDERVREFELRIRELQMSVTLKNNLVEESQRRIEVLEAELGTATEKFETAKFEHVKLRSAMRGAGRTPDAMQLASDPTESIPFLTPTIEEREHLNIVEVASDDHDDLGNSNEPRLADDATSDALTRRLTKEVALRRQLKVENEALSEELSAIRQHLIVTESTVKNSKRSPRERSGSTSKKLSTSQPSTHVATQTVTSTADPRVGQLTAEVDRLRTLLCELQSEQAAHHPVATFAYHVSAPPTLEDDTADINVAIESHLPSTRKHMAPRSQPPVLKPTEKKPITRQFKNDENIKVTDHRKRLVRPAGPPLLDSHDSMATEVSPFETTLAEMDCDMGPIQTSTGGTLDDHPQRSWKESRGRDRALSPTSDGEPHHSVSEIGETIYMRALDGGTSALADMTPDELRRTRQELVLLEAKIADKENTLQRMNTHCNNLNAEMDRLVNENQRQRSEIESFERSRQSMEAVQPSEFLVPTEPAPSSTPDGHESETHQSLLRVDVYSTCSTQTDLTLNQLRQLLASRDATDPTNVTVQPSRQGSARSANGGTILMDSTTVSSGITLPTAHRTFSDHRKVQNVSHQVAAQRVGRQLASDVMFYVTGDGLQDGENHSVDERGATPHTGLTTSTKLLRAVRPMSSTSQRGNAGTVVDRLTSAVAVAKGLADRNKAQRADSSLDEDETVVAIPVRPTSSAQRSSALLQIGKPLPPTVLSGLTETVQVLAKTQLAKHPLRMMPSNMCTQMAEEDAAVPAVVEPLHVLDRPNHAVAAPCTVDHREHIAQVLLGGGEDGAIRGVKSKIKQNINVEKFLNTVLTVRK